MLRLIPKNTRASLATAFCGLAAILLSPGRLSAQAVPPPTNTNINFNTAAGVSVDANGVLKMQTAHDPTGMLLKQRREAAKAALDPKLAAPSKLRKISLNRLEDAIKELKKAEPARRILVEGYFQFCVDLTALIYSDKEAELLQRRGRAAQSAAA